MIIHENRHRIMKLHYDITMDPIWTSSGIIMSHELHYNFGLSTSMLVEFLHYGFNRLIQ